MRLGKSYQRATRDDEEANSCTADTYSLSFLDLATGTADTAISIAKHFPRGNLYVIMTVKEY